MANEQSGWDAEIVEKMSTKAIEAKMRELVPGFDLAGFAAKTAQYVSYEDLAEEEYYPKGSLSADDEDFIWMACSELWKRVAPDKVAVEHLAEDFDSKMEEIAKAAEKKQLRKVVKLYGQAFELIFRHIIERTESGYRLRREFYYGFRESAIYDVDEFFDEVLVTFLAGGKHAKAEELAEILATAFEDDTFLVTKAVSLIARGKRDDGERCFQHIRDRNPDNPWFSVYAGDTFLQFGEPDYARAKTYYLQARDVAKAASHLPAGREALEAVYERLIGLADEIGDAAEAAHYQKLLDATRVASSTTATSQKIGRNEPCPCGSGKKYKKCCGQGGTEPVQAPAYDRRLMKRQMLAVHQMVDREEFTSVEAMNRYVNRKLQSGQVPEWTPETLLEKAQDLVYKALETSGKERIRLANEALKVSPDCADAYVVLAEEEAQSLQEACRLYGAGVKAGERTLGEEVFREEAGKFWGIIETRPYMRARAGLAQCLWAAGKRQEAIGHYQEMLRLNPGDNQGIRYPLAASLLEIGEIDALEELLEQYDEAEAAWLYTGALVDFLREGDSPNTRHRLVSALEQNPHVAAYLLGEKRLPKQLPEYIGHGDESEAVAYAADFGVGWLETKGAIPWLRSVRDNEQAIRRPMSAPTAVPPAFVEAFEPERKAGKTRQEDTGKPIEIYIFKVSLTEAPEVWRKIEIRGDQTLHDLHKAIFKAYKRYDEHLYAFFLSNKPWDSSSEYSLSSPESNAKNAKRTRIDSLALKPKKKFLYLFDFGDEWWHSVQLFHIRHEGTKGRYPRVIESQGEAPPQYPSIDEE